MLKIRRDKPSAEVEAQYVEYDRLREEANRLAKLKEAFDAILNHVNSLPE